MRAGPRRGRPGRRGLLALGGAALALIIVGATYSYVLEPGQAPLQISLSPVAASAGGGPGDPCSSVAQQHYNVSSDTNPPEANYAKQVWAILGKGGVGLEANVTAVAQSDAYGYGLAYWLNGQSNAGLWYQVGVAWNWPLSSDRGYLPGFSFLEQVWNSSNARVDSHISPLAVEGGDTISLFLNISRRLGEVIMGVSNNNMPGIELSRVYPSQGASVFLTTLGQTDHPTSTLMETYSANLVCAQDPTVFSAVPPSHTVQLRIDEWNFTGTPVSERFVSDPSSPQWSSFPSPAQVSGSAASCLDYLGTDECAS